MAKFNCSRIYAFNRGAGGLLSLVLFISACATPGDRPLVVENANRSIDEALQQGIASNNRQPTPSDASAVWPELMPVVPIIPGNDATAAGLQEPRFDVNVRKLPIDQFYSSLVQDTNYNVVMHPSVKGNVTLNISNVTVPELMQTMRQVYGYSYKRVGNTFNVLAAGLQSRVFKVDYLNVQRTGISQTRVTSGQVSQVGNNENGSNGNNGGAGGDDNSAGLSGTVIETATASDFWAELTQSLEVLIGGKEGRAVVVSPQTGVIVVKAMSDELQQIEEYLSTTQGILQRQVILEAKIIEVELSDGFQSGVNWSLLSSRDGGSLLAGQVGGGSLLEGGASPITGSTGNLNPNNPNFPLGTVASAFGGAFTLSLEVFDDFTAFLEFLETQGNVRVLSSPRVATVNNQKAVIKVGSDEFFVTEVSSTTTASAGATVVTPEIELTPFFSGISLDVTPQISGDGLITLHVHPSVSEVVDQRKTITVFGQTQDLPLAFSTIRESDSIVSARNGQVVVIGGLMQDSSQDDRAGVPLLGRMPLLGGLFRHQRRVNRKSELVILLRPVVADSSAWNAELRDAAGRIDRINRQLTNDGVTEGYVPADAVGR